MSEVKWTNEQLQAIQKNKNNILVAAAAGSGKTAVLVERIINKIINEKVDIDKILIVTFTNAAASEMRERILEAIYKRIEEEPNNIHLQKQINLIGKASICTIDSFCLDVVKNNFYEIEISPNFRIADTAELELIKQETLENLFEKKYEVEDCNFLKLLETYTTYIGDEPLKEIILNIHNFIQSTPFPIKWLDEQVEKYNLNEKLMEDFSTSLWGKIIIDNIKEEILNAKIKIENVREKVRKFIELKKYELVLNQDIEILDKMLKLESWDDIYNYSQEMSFEKWPIDRKVELEEKEIAKDKRNEIKKEIKKSLEIMDCDSKQAREDIMYMYDILKKLYQIIIEYDQMLREDKKEKNILDFSDIEHMALNILISKDKNGNSISNQVAKKYKEKFVEIAIDEYQDSNLVQESILTSISNDNNIFMVGDVKQSIYKFRQARPELFLEKYEKYSSVKNFENNELTEKTKIQLFKNFRSRENILNTTNLIFKEIMSKELGDIEYLEKEYLNIGASYEQIDDGVAKNTDIYIIDNKESEEQNLEVAENEENIIDEPIENIELEAKFVAKKVKEIIESKKIVFDKKQGNRKVTYKDIVILLRSTKDKANIFEAELANLEIPVYSDTSLEYLGSIEIQTIMNLLKIIDNPMQDIPLVCVLRSIIGGFEDNELIEMRLSTNSKISFYESMKEYEKCENELANKIRKFFQKLENWREESKYLDLDEFIWKIYIDTGYYNYVSLMPDGILRQANLKLLFEKAKQYEKASFKGLYNFINFIDKVKMNSGDLSSAKLIGENENVVRIMSIHKSKGLEFPIVFLCNSNKKFNMQDLNNQILLHQDLGLGVNYIDEKKKMQYSTFAKEAIKIKARKEIISEEMRILYVALTRARERLIITGIQKDLEKKLKEKQELINMYSQEEKINKNILKKYKSYLDWMELVCLKNLKTEVMNITSVKKEEIINKDNLNKQVNEKLEFEKQIELIDEKKVENINNKLEWKYNYIDLSKIEGKSSVSKIKELSNKDKQRIIMKTPQIVKKEKKTLTGAEKGTLIHLCMQKLNVKEEYNYNKIEELIKSMQCKNIITEVEAKNIEINKILNFTTTIIWKELKSAKIIEREKPFYINIPVKEICNKDLEEEILVQGIIDLFYINERDELILVDYKTDFVKEKEELINKYRKQLELYKNALEEALNKKVDRTYIYSTYLEEEILV